MPFFTRRKQVETPASNKLRIKNETVATLEVHVELNPDRYLLKPGQEMEIEGDLRGEPYEIIVHPDSIVIYPGNDAGSPVKIDGLLVKPDWTTPSA